MKRMKRHKIKTEKPEACATHSRNFEEHDLAYYIHDRVELMHQVFSILKYKEIKAMAPQTVRDLAVGDLQELCTEELLGISSKRLVAILDGAEPPSDTESSSQSPTPDPMETISLDSISSDEEILSQSSKKKKHKHSKSRSKKKRDKQKAKETAEAKPDDSMEVSKASRAGLTVLELLELQARARAIRAQLQNEQHLKKLSTQTAAEADSSDEDDAVQIKEESPEVVEISSGDEKPDVRALEAQVQNTAKQKEPQDPKEPPKAKDIEDTAGEKQTEAAKIKEASKKKVKAKKKSKQKENTKENSTEKVTPELNEASIPKESENSKDTEVKEASQLKSTVTRMASDNPTEADAKASQLKSSVTKRVKDLIITVPQPVTSRKIKLNRNKVTVTVLNVAETSAIESRTAETVEKPDDTKADKKKKLKKNKKKKMTQKDGSDHDEITLQLSDSEKMDLLEDLNGKSYGKLSSSADSESSSSDTDIDTSNKNISNVTDAVNEKSETDVTINEKEIEMASVIDNNKESTIEMEVNNEAEIAQSEIMDITKSIDQGKSEQAQTSDKQSNVENNISNNEEDDESITNNKVQSLVKDSPVSHEENDPDESIDVNNKNVGNNQDVDANIENMSKVTSPKTDTNTTEIHTSAGESVNITTELDVVTATDVPKNSEETDKIMTNIQKDTESVNKQLIASDLIETEDATQEKEKIEDHKETVNETIIEQKETCTKDIGSKVETSLIDNIPVNVELNKETDANKASVSDKGKDRDISEGELSDRESSEVEAFDMEPEVVCISDDDTQKNKKKKKKEKKAKKDKKSKKSKKDFREHGDQNFYKDADKLAKTDITDKQAQKHIEAIDIDKQSNIDIKAIDIIDGDENNTEPIDITDDVYEILELSDDSSCYEVEGTVLSKEPTADEIAALSATIDDINEYGIESKDEEAIYDHNDSEKGTKHDGNASGESEENTAMSWKERYLDSNKVKKVLTTAHILNALRNKNKQLKKKMEESKQKTLDVEIDEATDNQATEEIAESVADESENTEKMEDRIEEGSMEHYQTLPTLPKYVTTESTSEMTQTGTEVSEIDTDITKELKRDAKQLFKIYKKLICIKKAKRSEKKRLRKVRKRIERYGLDEDV